MAGQLGGIDVDADHPGRSGQAALRVHVIVGRTEFGAHRQHGIGTRNQCAHRRQTGAGSDGQGVAIHQATGVDGLNHRRADPFGQRLQCRFGPPRAAARQNDRAPGAVQQARGGTQIGGVGNRREWQPGRDGQGGAGHWHHVQRHLQMHRSAPRGGQRGKGAVQRAGQRLGAVNPFRMQRQSGDQGALVGQFVQMAQTKPQRGAGIDARYHQHRHRISPGLPHGSQDIGHPRPGDDERHAGFARNPGIAIGHEARSPFVTRRYMADARPGQTTVQLDRVNAGDAEHHVNAACLQPGDQRLSDRCHGSSDG